jgi:TolA-binding protein
MIKFFVNNMQCTDEARSVFEYVLKTYPSTQEALLAGQAIQGLPAPPAVKKP